MKTRAPRRIAAGLAGLTLALTTGRAHAQNALGDGRALDRPLLQGARVNPARIDFAAEAALRNAIVTGNVGGGRAFRGDVGYRAPGEFTGGLSSFSTQTLRDLGLTPGAVGGAGSDDLFAFQRDAVGSALAVRGLGGLQNQMALTTGLGRSGAAANLIVSRPSGAPITGDAALGETARALTLNPFTLRPGALRSTSEHLSDTFLNPTLLDRHDPGPGQALTYTIANPLRGVVRFTTPAPETPSVAPTDADEPSGADGASSPLRVDGYISGRLSDRVESTPISEPYSTLLESLREKIRTPDETDAETTPATRATPGATDADPFALPLPDADAPATPTPAVPNDAASLDARLARLRAAMTTIENGLDVADVRDTLAVLRRAAAVVPTYAPRADADRDVFAQHMRIAQQYLAENRWFDAEERFSSALLVRPGDPIAMAGRLHAEIGAGLFLSASVNVRTLIREHPEFIAVRFDADLLPSPERLIQIEARLRGNTTRTSPMAAHSGLLLAYVGHQLNDPDLIRTGLEAIDRIHQAADEAPDPFIEVLRAAWTPETE